MRAWPALLRLLLFCLSCSALSGLGAPARARAAEAVQAETRVRASDLTKKARVSTKSSLESRSWLQRGSVGNPNASGSPLVYNLEVEQWHTYVVGDLGAWVHNACDPKDAVKQLVRFGKGPETAKQLAADAAKAEAHGFPHGVSTKMVERVSGSDKVHRSAVRAEVEKFFTVEQTGRNPQHHTVHLPKPVTDEAARIFNMLFPPK
jgi:hypothetical protein